MLSPGDVISGYRLERVLGRGGMGTVYEATQLTLDRVVAVKVLSADLSDDPRFQTRFRREGMIQARLEHPHIVTVYEAGETDDYLFLAMRLVRGPTLKDMILSRELDPGRALRILSSIADALDTAHAAGLIHRDIKPQNILVAARDHPFLADFGLTKVPGEKSLTKTGQFVGTLDYISPEQVGGSAPSPRSDVYSLAAVLYECLTGIVPFPASSDAALLYAHMTSPPPSPTGVRPELPPSIDAVIHRAMAKEPADRHAGAGEMLLDASRAFGSRRFRAVMMPPGPIETPQETGIRPTEDKVPTRERTAGALTGADSRAPVTVPAVTAHRVAPVPTAHAAPAPALDTSAWTAASPAPAVGVPPGPALPVAPAPAPAETVARGARRGPGVRVLAGFALALVALAAGFAARGGDTGSAAADASNSATAGSVALRFGGEWRPLARQARLPGLRLADPITLGESHGTRMLAGMSQAEGPTLLPSGFTKQLTAPPGDAPVVKVGALTAVRYRDLHLRGSEAPLEVYAAPTSRGVATFACMGPAAGATLASRCETVLTTATLTGAEAYPVGPRESYAARLRTALDVLASRRAAARATLAGARLPAAQALAATRLASAYREAAAKVGGSRPSPRDGQASASLAAALRTSAGSYSALAAATRRGRRDAYASATAGVGRGEGAVARALSELRKLGYRVG
jgi:hypothetical protein